MRRGLLYKLTEYRFKAFCVASSTKDNVDINRYGTLIGPAHDVTAWNKADFVRLGYQYVRGESQRIKAVEEIDVT